MGFIGLIVWFIRLEGKVTYTEQKVDKLFHLEEKISAIKESISEVRESLARIEGQMGHKKN